MFLYSFISLIIGQLISWRISRLQIHYLFGGDVRCSLQMYTETLNMTFASECLYTVLSE